MNIGGYEGLVDVVCKSLVFCNYGVTLRLLYKKYVTRLVFPNPYLLVHTASISFWARISSGIRFPA